MGDAGILLIGLRAVFPVLNLTTEYDSLPVFWQFLPLGDGLIFEPVILDHC